jgi:hypothetical protein
VNDENGDLLAEFHNILDRRKKYFSKLLNVRNVSDASQIEIQTSEEWRLILEFLRLNFHCKVEKT